MAKKKLQDHQYDALKELSFIETDDMAKEDVKAVKDVEKLIKKNESIGNPVFNLLNRRQLDKVSTVASRYKRARRLVIDKRNKVTPTNPAMKLALQDAIKKK